MELKGLNLTCSLWELYKNSVTQMRKYVPHRVWNYSFKVLVFTIKHCWVEISQYILTLRYLHSLWII